MKVIESPHGLHTLERNEATIEAGRKMSRDAKSWMERNRDAFFEILGYVRELQGRGVKGRIRDRVCVFCMVNAIDVDDAPQKFKNGMFAPLSRYMGLVDPSLIDNPLKFNDSVIDCYGLLPVSYLPGLGE